MFLYRFLQENLTYITTMLAMRLPPAEQQAPAEAAGAPEAAVAGPMSPRTSEVQQAQQQQGAGGGAAAQAQAQAPLQPFVLLMDVKASAPNICLPRNSGEAEEPQRLAEERKSAVVLPAAAQPLPFRHAKGQLLSRQHPTGIQQMPACFCWLVRHSAPSPLQTAWMR